MQSSPLESAPADTKGHWLAAQPAQILRDRLVLVSMVIWVLVIVATPIALWTMGQPGLLAALQAGVLTQVVTVLLVLVRAGMARQALLVATAVPLLGWLVEFVGQASGIPFGSYHYTPLLQPQLAGVPVLIPLAWLMMMPPAWAVALVIVGAQPGWRARVLRAAVAALAFTAWDLFLDPQMVAWNVWVWAAPGAYFGIPLVNFAGWLLVAFCVSLLRPALRASRLALIPSSRLADQRPAMVALQASSRASASNASWSAYRRGLPPLATGGVAT